MTMTTYNWNICNINCYPEAEGQTDVAFQVNWQCSANDGTYNASTYGSVALVYTAGEPFTPYAQLTQEQVWGWCDTQINRPEIEANLQTMLDAQANPTVVTPALPWATV
jgi:hypothetical protein